MKNAALEELRKDSELYAYLEQRLGKTHLRRRLGVEIEHEADRFGQGRTFFNIENWRTAPLLIGLCLKLTGLATRGRANITDFRVRENPLRLPQLPAAFEGFTLLQLSDLHLDALPDFADRLAAAVAPLEYDICVLTGDYRFQTHGPHDPAMAGLQRLRRALRGEVFAVLGNHDSVLTARDIEAQGIRLLLNEHVRVGGEADGIYLAGIDDPHYFATDNLEAAYAGIPDSAVSVLLSHSPEIFRHAAFVGFDVMLCGHTHGGQICLPGGLALTYNSSAPRYTGAGAWSFDLMQGYTSSGTGSSVVPARFNCPPEITLHRLTRGAGGGARPQ